MSASVKDILSNQKGWVHELARAELHPDAEKLLNLSKSLDPQALVEESTQEFMADLRDEFHELAKIFNAYSENGSKFADIKVYQVANTVSDFMLYRNQIKLVVSNPAHGVIQLQFASHIQGQGMGATNATNIQTTEILAQVGPFRDVYWTYQGQQISSEQISKYFFGEFVRTTRDTSKRTKVSNQVLLDQIKALLQEKGLEL